MSELKLVTANAYTKEEALVKISADTKVNVKFDATQAWKNAGSPTGAELEEFAKTHLNNKIKGVSGVDFSITVEAGVADTRERPYSVTKNIVEGISKWYSSYEGFVGGDDTGIGGTKVFIARSKDEAEKLAKEYTTQNKVTVKVLRSKEVVGNAVALVSEYTPSLGTKLGTYIVFGYEA